MKKRYDNPNKAGDDDDIDEGPSKTQLKKAMLELQDLGLAMLNLPDEQLDTLVVNEGLRDALRDLRRITSHGARNRQAGYVGKLMRDFDTAPFRAALALWHSHKTRDAKALHDIEQWRERIIAGDEGWAAWIALHPETDTRQARALVRDARRERGIAKLKDESGNGRAFRALFKLVRTASLVKPDAGKA